MKTVGLERNIRSENTQDIFICMQAKLGPLECSKYMYISVYMKNTLYMQRCSSMHEQEHGSHDKSDVYFFADHTGTEPQTPSRGLHPP